MTLYRPYIPEPKELWQYSTYTYLYIYTEDDAGFLSSIAGPSSGITLKASGLQIWAIFNELQATLRSSGPLFWTTWLSPQAVEWHIFSFLFASGLPYSITTKTQKVHFF